MGLFCLVLHTHLPYVRRNGVWPCGEDFFHQAATESYVPVLTTLERLADRGMRDVLTLGLSPMVAHQMADPSMRAELDSYIARVELRGWRNAVNYDGVFRDEFRDLAAFYARFARAQEAALDAHPEGLAAGFDGLARAGVIELLGGPATHPFLPLVTEPALADAQIRSGIQEHRRLFGRAPRGMWLPECAYKPGIGLEQMLEAHGVAHVVVDGPTMLRSAGPGSTFAPAKIGSSDVVAFARDLDVTYRVWSPTGGYPAGKWYRDFFHYDLEAGFKNWRVTSVRKPVEEKRPYEPARALAAARSDAEDFAAVIVAALAEHERASGREGVVVAAYDTELFGHWWFEGPAFLERLYEVLAEIPGVTPATLASARERLPEPAPVELVEGSWGFRKDDRSWVADETRPMWDALTDVEAETVRLVEKHGGSAGARGDAVAQLLRECMLLQASDWPFMVVRGRNPAYARERFDAHRARWERLARALGDRTSDQVLAAIAAELFAIDNILPDARAAL